MKILCCGGAGYVGSSLIPVLVDHGYNITVIDLMWFDNNLPKEVDVIQKDLFECSEEDVKGFDCIIWLAGMSNDPSAEHDLVRNFVYNAALPAQIALMAKRVGVKRFIYASTCSVYGYTVNELYDEESKISCNYAYGVSKLMGEKGVMHLQDDTFSVICLRKGTISGISARMRFDLIVNTMTKNAMLLNEITINNPAIWRPIISIKDVTAAYLRAIQSNYSLSGVFNIAYSNFTVGEVAYIVKDIVEKKIGKKIKLKILNIKDVRNYKVTTEKAQTMLGFHPRHTISDIVENILNSWNKFELDINNDKYYNINICKKLFKNSAKII